jgi:hypothetical protein
LYPAMSNRGLPAGRGYDVTKPKPFPAGPYSDSYEAMQPAKRNLAAAGLDSKHYFTRGGYERQVAQAITDKDGSEGYAKNPNKTSPKELDPQGYFLVSPGRHYISLQDQPDFCRLRIKTTTGHQILLDDTNERIYCSTNKGKSWFEMDSDGHVHFYGAESLSFTTDADYNVTAKGNINLHAGNGVNIKADGDVKITGGGDINLNSGCSTLVTAGDNIHLGAAGNIVEKGAKIYLNTMGTTAAALAPTPGIVPSHEPFDRPKGKATRNKYWKP